MQTLSADRLTRGDALPAEAVQIADPWATLYEHMVEAAVADGRIEQCHAATVQYLYFPQSDGTLCVFARFPTAPDVLLGTTVPAGDWWQDEC